MNSLKEPKIYFKGQDREKEPKVRYSDGREEPSNFCIDYLPGYLDKIAIDYSAKKIRGTIYCVDFYRENVNSPWVDEKPHKVVLFWSFDKIGESLVIEK